MLAHAIIVSCVQTNSPALAVATAELSVRLDRLKREVERPLPPPRAPGETVLDAYAALCRSLRAERGRTPYCATHEWLAEQREWNPGTVGFYDGEKP